MKTKLIEDNMNLVYALVSREYPTYLNDEDIIQCGMLGLCQAAENWDESRSTFSNYAWCCIRHEIIGELKRRSKYQGVLSLDYPVNDEDGGKATFGDFIAGDDGVNLIDVSVDMDKLTGKQPLIYSLLVDGVSQEEIVRRLNVTDQYVTCTKRKIRLLRQHADRKV